jgi:preprotein translocase subunit SecE
MAGLLNRTTDYLSDVRTEMSKVTWPDWPQLRNATLVMLVFVVIITLLIFGIDIVVRLVLGIFPGLLGG